MILSLRTIKGEGLYKRQPCPLTGGAVAQRLGYSRNRLRRASHSSAPHSWKVSRTVISRTGAGCRRVAANSDSIFSQIPTTFLISRPGTIASL